MNDTLVLLGIPSSIEIPSGPGRVLRTYLGMGERLGFRAVAIDDRIGYIEYGGGEEYIAVLGHLDTVPVGEGWTREPSGEVVGGRLYGRGALDDKEPMVAALHALAALRDAEVPLERKVRIIVGTDEETDDAAISYYRSRGPDPVTGFSPDGDFPVVYAEKGLLWADWHRPARTSGGPVDLLSLEGGTAPNVVPDRAEAVLEAAEPDRVAAALRRAGCGARGRGAAGPGHGNGHGRAWERARSRGQRPRAARGRPRQDRDRRGRGRDRPIAERDLQPRPRRRSPRAFDAEREREPRRLPGRERDGAPSPSTSGTRPASWTRRSGRP